MNSTIQSRVDDYVYSKMIQSMIFRNRITDILEHERWQEDINSINFLKALKNIIIANEYQEIIEPVVKDGLFRIINHLRFNKPYQTITEEQESSETYNHLIRTLNTSKDDNKYNFYAHELCKRYNHTGFPSRIISLIYRSIIIEMDKQYLFSSISNDFGVIVNQSELVDDYHFNQEVMPNYLNNHYYIDSINAILNEESHLFCNLTFSDRTYNTLEKNLENNKMNDKYLIRRNIQTLKRIDSFM